MIATILIAAAAAFVPVAQGDAMLATKDATVSDAAREVLGGGGRVACRTASKSLPQVVCLTADEWRAVLKDAKLFDRRDQHAPEDVAFKFRVAPGP